MEGISIPEIFQGLIERAFVYSKFDFSDLEGSEIIEV